MTQHTPGPWRISPSGNCDIDAANGKLEIASTHQDLLTGGFRDPETAQADARLIAAAPDLLEAMQSALYQLEQFTTSETRENDPDLWAAQVEAIAAIEKATGKAVQS